MGIIENYLKVIFDRIIRIEDDATLDLLGLGLGWSITKAYIEMLGGQISVQSTLGLGICIYIYDSIAIWSNYERDKA